MSVGGLRNTGIVQDGLVFSIDAYNSKSNQSIVNNLKSGISTGGTGTNGVQTNTAFKWSFDGTNDYINFGVIPEINNIDYNTPLSIDCWIIDNGQSSTKAIFGNGAVDDLDPGSSGFWIIITNTGILSFHERQDATPPANIVRSSSPLSDPVPTGVWTHICVTYDGSNDSSSPATQWYINGKAVTTTAGSNDNLTSMTSINPLLVGCGAGQAAIGTFPLTERHFDGEVASINIWKNKTLTATEVLQNYNNTKNRFTVYAPQTLPTINLISDWDAENGVYVDGGITLATNGQEVEQWVDKSNNLIASGSTGKPTYNTSGTGFSKKPYLDFDGTDNFLEVIGPSLYKDKDISFYVVSEIDSASLYDVIFQKGPDWNWEEGWVVSLDGAGRLYSTVGDWPTNEVVESSGNLNKLEVRAMRFRTSTPSGTRVINTGVRRNDGHPKSSGAYTQLTLSGQDINDATNKNALIGAGYDGSGNPTTYFLDGKIYRLLVYNTYHDDVTYNNTIRTLLNTYR
jgi:hypothetical protein